MFCRYCGGEVKDGKRFCSQCGRDQMAGDMGQMPGNMGQMPGNMGQMNSWTGTPGIQVQEKKKSKLKYVLIGGVLVALVAVVGISAAVISLGKRNQEAQEMAERREEERREEERLEREERRQKEREEAEAEEESGSESGAAAAGGEKSPAEREETASSGSTKPEEEPVMETESFFMEQETEGIMIADTLTISARDDIIFEFVETLEVDLSTFDAESQDMVCEAYDELVEQYQSVDGVKCRGIRYEGGYRIDISVDTTGDAAWELQAMGLMELQGSGGTLSLETSRDFLLAAGYERI